MIRVVHCKRSDYDVYIGRPSIWGNPFVIGRDGSRAEVIAKYEAWIVRQPKLMSQLHELRGKILGCWCSPAPCHGEVLARLAGGLTNPSMSHSVHGEPAVRQMERRHDMAKKAKKSATKKTAKKAAQRPATKKFVKAAKSAKKTSKKTVKAAQSTRKRVMAEKAPKKKGERKFDLKPAIPIEKIKHVVARVQIPALIEEIREYDEQTAEVMADLGPALEAIADLRKEAVEKLTQLSADAHVEVVEGDDWRLSYVAGETKRLDQTKLLELGVKMSTIKKAIVTTKNKPYVRISKKAEVNEESVS